MVDRDYVRDGNVELCSDAGEKRFDRGGMGGDDEYMVYHSTSSQ
jgi:hypothetical protein